MQTQPLQLFIVDDNPMVTTGLKAYLQNRFGNSLDIFTFLDGKTALKKVNADTGIVILDYYLENENGNDVLKSITKINPQTEVIMLSSNEDMGIAIDAFRNGATDYVIKGEKSWKRINSLVYKIITYPLRVMVKEFGINKYIARFLLTFVTIGVAVYLSLKFIH